MSEQAVLRRIRSVDKLRYLCLKLMKATKKTDADDEQENQKDDRKHTK